MREQRNLIQKCHFNERLNKLFDNFLEKTFFEHALRDRKKGEEEHLN